MALLAASCGDAEEQPIVSRWKYVTASPAAPPGLGPERRVVVALRGNAAQGELVTVNEADGLKVEGPFTPVLPTEHAPVAVDTTLYLTSSIGRLIAYNLRGEQLFSEPMNPLGVASPIARAPDKTLRVASTNGRVAAFRPADGSTIFDVTAPGAVTSAPAIAPDGATFVATDVGTLSGFDPSGGSILELALTAPASGPSVDPGGTRIAVGEGDAVRVVDRGGAELFRRPRNARVVGTRWLSAGELLAWGEDGVLERLDAAGNVLTTFTTDGAAPIYADVIQVGSGDFAVFDNNGIVYRVSLEGAVESRLDLGETPLPELVRGELRFVFVAVGNSVQALDFELD